ncbi:HlyC/CorC family transporter [Sporolactobacillus sp. THM7-7]|nr:HlyC/CorC family transporter [Sporolactobacillus sp. THM7-7]
MNSSADDPGSPVLFQFALIGVLTLLNAFFAAAEMALVSLNKKRVAHQADQGDKKAIRLNKLIADPGKFLATIQVGITFANFFSSASAATGLVNHVAGLMGHIPYAAEIAVIVITLLLSYVTLVFGELFPKRLALQNAEKMARFSVTPILFISRVAMPFVKLLSFSTNVLAKIVRLGSPEETEKVTSREEIKLLVQSGRGDGSISADEYIMIKGILELRDRMAREVMTPRTDAFVISIDTSPEELARLLLNEKYSRIPVYQTDRDNIVGILNIKDYYKAAHDVGFDQVTLPSLLREPYFVPETKAVDDLFQELQTTHHHLAVLIDEYGGFAGIVTMEDLLEEIVGEIDDEFDKKERELTRIDERTYLANGGLEIDTFNDYFRTNIDIRDFDTIAGFILSQIGLIPEDHKQAIVKYENILFTVESVKNNRLEKIRIEVKQPLSKATQEVTA